MDKSILLNYTTMRKCFLCKDYLTLETSQEYIYYKDKLYHISCLKIKLNNKKVGKLSEDEINKLIDGLKEESESRAWNLMIKNHLYKFLMEKYNVIMLPTHIYTKMEQIFTGEYKNMTKPIKPEHLLDMWQRKQSYLDKIWHKEKLDGVSLINYNLQVLISKYNDYLLWIEKTKSDNEKSQIKSEEQKPEMKIIFNNKNMTQEESDIFSDIQ